METFFLWFFFVVIALGILIAWGFWYGEATKNRLAKKTFNEEYSGRYQALMNARAKHDQNVAHLNRIGFHTDRWNQIGNRYFSFDHTKKQASHEEFYFNDKFLPLTRKTDQAILAIPKSYCGDLIVFPYDKIIECTLLQDGAVIKNSEGAAALAGSQLAIFGALQGTASTKSGERQTGILSVRLTLDDIQVPSVLFNFTGGGVDKSSDVYAEAFHHAQEVFGIFDAIVRMNLKARTVLAPQSAPAAVQPAPAPDANEDIFEKIRQLGKLRDEGLLTEDEFNDKKKLLMDQIK